MNDCYFFIGGSRGTGVTVAPSYEKYKLNTTFYSIIFSDPTKAIFFDLGTGVANFPNLKNLKEIHIFFSHFHWDHIMGIHTLKDLCDPSVKITIYYRDKTLGKGNSSLSDLFYRTHFYRNGFFSKDPSRRLDVEEKTFMRHDSLSIYGVEIKTEVGNHPDGVSMYRVRYNNTDITMTGDFEHSPRSNKRLIEFAKNSNYLIYDACYIQQDYEGTSGTSSRKGWGHSTNLFAALIAKESNVKNLLLTHFAFHYSDAEIEMIEEETQELFSNTICSYPGLKINFE